MSTHQLITRSCFPVLAVLFFFQFADSLAQDLPPEVLSYADMVLYNGQVLTMDRDQPPFTVAEALAVRDGRIMAVGGDDRILRMAGPHTVQVNLDGKGVIPGIVDTHSHPNSYTLRHYRQEVTPAYSEYLEANGIRSLLPFDGTRLKPLWPTSRGSPKASPPGTGSTPPAGKTPRGGAHPL